MHEDTGADGAASELRQIFDDLVRFETVLWAALDERLRRECDLSLGDLNVMMIIDATRFCRVREIARALEITVGGASQAVDRLEKAGRCTRSPHPDDRRSSIVTLTATGSAALGRAVPVFDEELRRMLGAPLTPPRLRTLADGLHTLRRSADDGRA